LEGVQEIGYYSLPTMINSIGSNTCWITISRLHHDQSAPFIFFYKK